MSLETLLRRLRREEPPSPAMAAGSALHKLLEHSSEGIVAREGCDGYMFRFDGECELSLPVMRELRGTRDYVTPHGIVTLSGRVDAMDGLTVYDHKLTKQFDAERYASAYQWRAYLSIFGAETFTYNLFIGSEDKADPMVWNIKDFHAISFPRYPEMEADLQREVEAYAEFAAHYLTVAA